MRSTERARSIRSSLRTALAASVACIAMTLAAPAAAAQQTAPPQPETAEDPDVPIDDTVTEDTVAEEEPFVIDLGITVDEDGNIIFNVDADTTDAEPVAPAPTPATADPSVSGTGSVPAPETGTVDTGTPIADDPGAGRAEPEPLQTPGLELDTSGSGNHFTLILAVAGGVAALAVGIYFLARMHRQRKEELALEEPIDLLANERLAGEFPDLPDTPEPAYEGADDTGAYEVGGAAHAQYSASGAGGSPLTPPAPATTSPSRFDQLRSGVVNLADRGLADAGHDRLVAKKLEAAGSQMRPGEWLVMAVAGTAGVFFGVTFLLGWILGVAAAVLAAAAFWQYMNFQESRRQREFADALPETLQLLSGSLRGGLSMMQAIQTVADEADEPTAGEFHRIITESRLGRDLALSFRDLSERMDSTDFEWIVTAIEIHREVGGDLAAILDRVSNTIRARNRVRGQVKALSAEGKMSGLILFVLPPAMVGAISLLNRQYLNEMIGSGEGQVMLIVAAALLIAGGLWLKRLARFVY